MTSKAPPGLNFPTQLPYEAGAGTPRQSALIAQQNSAAKQTSLINSSGGSRRSRHKRSRRHLFYGGDYVVPQYQMSYTPQGGPGQTPNDIIKSTSQNSTQTVANQQYDGLVGQKAGTKICENGQTGCWGCYSGGGYRKTKKRQGYRRRKRNTRKVRKVYKR